MNKNEMIKACQQALEKVSLSNSISDSILGAFRDELSDEATLEDAHEIIDSFMFVFKKNKEVIQQAKTEFTLLCRS